MDIEMQFRNGNAAGAWTGSMDRMGMVCSIYVDIQRYGHWHAHEYEHGPAKYVVQMETENWKRKTAKISWITSLYFRSKAKQKFDSKMKEKKRKAGLLFHKKTSETKAKQIPFTYFPSLQSKQIFVTETSASTVDTRVYCSGPWKPGSWCRLSKAHGLLGKPRKPGIWNGEGLGRVVEGKVSSRATWGQGGQDRTTQREGFQVSKGESKGNQRGASKGGKKMGLRHIYIVNLYMCI
jgi:hypothetical protein